MPMIAVASFTLSTLALTCDSHSGWSGWPSSRMRDTKRLVAADDHHDQKVGDHHDVDEAEHDEHHERFRRRLDRSRRRPA